MEPGEDHLFAEAVQTGLDGDSSRAEQLLGWLRRKRGSWRVWMCMRMRLWRRRRGFSFMGWSIDMCTVMYHWDGRFFYTSRGSLRIAFRTSFTRPFSRFASYLTSNPFFLVTHLLKLPDPSHSSL